MKTIRTLILSLTLSFTLTLPAYAQLTIADLTAQLSQPQELRAHFSQERTLTGFSRTLKAQGTLLVSREHGILWRQSAPFAQDVVIDERGILVGNASGLKTMSKADNPQLQAFAQMLQALFAGDLSALEQFFALELKGEPAKWQLTLTPTQEPINLIFSAIELEGAQYVNHVTLKDRAGDSTKIQFTEHQTKPSALTSDEEQLFAH